MKHIGPENSNIVKVFMCIVKLPSTKNCTKLHLSQPLNSGFPFILLPAALLPLPFDLMLLHKIEMIYIPLFFTLLPECGYVLRIFNTEF